MLAGTATVLSQSSVNEDMKFVTAGMNPMNLQRGILGICASNTPDFADRRMAMLAYWPFGRVPL